jgi:uncharacterized glyoxalase superfamily protein PhnB
MSQSVFPVVRAREPRALIAWLEQVLDAGLLELHETPEGGVGHAEVRVADGVVTLGEAGGELAQAPGTAAVYVATDEVDALHERAVSAGADVVMELTETDYGSRDFSVRDPEGNLWALGTYRPED